MEATIEATPERSAGGAQALGQGVVGMQERAIMTHAVRAAAQVRPPIEGGRWIAIAACTYVAAWVIGLALGMASAAPGPTDSTGQIGTYFAAHREVAMIQAYCLDGLAGAALIVLAAALHRAFRPFEGENGALSSILFGAGVAAGTISLVQGLFTQVLADQVAALGNLATTRALFDLNGEGDTYKLLALGVCIGATALLTLRTRMLPSWIGWAGVVLAPLLVIAGWNFAFGAAAQLAAYTVLLLVLLLWVAAIGVAGLQRAA